MTDNTQGLDLSQLKANKRLTVQEFELQTLLRCPGCNRRLDHTTGCVEWMIVQLAPHPQLGVAPALLQVRTCKDEECPAWGEAYKNAWMCQELNLVWLESAPDYNKSDHVLVEVLKEKA